MASLLDLFVQRNLPTAGLLADDEAEPRAPVDVRGLMGGSGAPTPASAPSAPLGARQGGDFLDKLFAGGATSGLPEGASRGITRDAMFQAGLATLLSDEAGIGALAEGLAVGRGAAATGREAAVEEQKLAMAEREKAEREELRAKILTESDLSSQQGQIAAVQKLVAAGFTDEAQKIVNVMGTFHAPQVLSEGDRLRVFDPNTREITDTGIKLPGAPKDTSWQQVGDRLVLMDDQTGEPIKEWSNPDRLSTSELRSLANDAFDQTTGLRKEFQDITGKAQEAVALAEAALTGPEGDPATGQTLIIALNKILDPNSVVRESEFARVAEIGGITARLEGWLNKAEQGQLPESSEAAIRAEIARLKAAMQEQVAKQATFYTGLATQNGLNPNQVVRPSVLESLDGDSGVLSGIEGFGGS